MKKLMLPPVKAFIAVEVIYQGEVDEELDAELRVVFGRNPDARGSLKGVDRDQSWYFDINQDRLAEKVARMIKRRKSLGCSITMKVFGDQPVPPEPASTPTEHLG